MDCWLQVYGYIVSLQRELSTAVASDVHQIAATGTIAPSLVALALALGAIHALTPGHGKSIILSYFAGHQSRVNDGLLMAGRAAFAHSLTAVLLVLLVGSAASTWGRPSGAAASLQVASYAVITILGLYYFYSAIRKNHHHEHSGPGALPYAVGVLPCPLTMLIVGNAIAAGSVLAGVGLAILVAIGATATIGLFGTAGIVMRRALSATTRTSAAETVLWIVELTSSAAIFLIGLFFLAGSRW